MYLFKSPTDKGRQSGAQYLGAADRATRRQGGGTGLDSGGRDLSSDSGGRIVIHDVIVSAPITEPGTGLLTLSTAASTAVYRYR